MPDYTDVEIMPGMIGELDGFFYQVSSVVGDTVTATCLADGTEAIMDVPSIKEKANIDEMWVAWPPSLRQENMPEEESSSSGE